MRIQLNLSLDEIELHKEALCNYIALMGQRLNRDNFRESVLKLQEIELEIDKIDRAMKKGGPLHAIKTMSKVQNEVGVYLEKGSVLFNNGAIL